MIPDLPLLTLGDSITWQDYNALRNAILGAYDLRHLRIAPNQASPLTKVDITVPVAKLIASGDLFAIAQNVSVTIDLATTGAGGLDTGSLSANAIYRLYLIGKDLSSERYDQDDDGSSYYGAGTNFANGSAALGITDTKQDLEAAFEETGTPRQRIVVVTDGSAVEAWGYVGGIAKSGDNYVLDIYSDAEGSTRNWNKGGGFNESETSYNYVIKAPAGIAQAVNGLASTSPTEPVLPAGYTHKRRVGWLILDSSSQIISFEQRDEAWIYLAKHNALEVSAAASLTTLSLASYIPAEADVVQINAEVKTNSQSIANTLEIYAHGETSPIEDIYLIVGDSGEGGSNSKPVDIPVRLNSGAPAIGYAVVVGGGYNAATNRIDVKGCTYPISEEV